MYVCRRRDAASVYVMTATFLICICSCRERDLVRVCVSLSSFSLLRACFFYSCCRRVSLMFFIFCGLKLIFCVK